MVQLTTFTILLHWVVWFNSSVGIMLHSHQGRDFLLGQIDLFQRIYIKNEFGSRTLIVFSVPNFSPFQWNSSPEFLYHVIFEACFFEFALHMSCFKPSGQLCLSPFHHEVLLALTFDGSFASHWFSLKPVLGKTQLWEACSCSLSAHRWAHDRYPHGGMSVHC